jgi:hypothetical protein
MRPLKNQAINSLRGIPREDRQGDPGIGGDRRATDRGPGHIGLANAADHDRVEAAINPTAGRGGSVGLHNFERDSGILRALKCFLSLNGTMRF